jgi:hypothetical protein
MARKTKTQPQIPATIETQLPALIPSQDVVLPVVPVAGEPVMASDVKAITLSAADWAEDRTRTTQSQPWPFYLVRKSGGSKNGHQIRASGYAESCCPYMPNAALFAETGNPYPNKVEAPANVVSSPKFNHYRVFAVLGHAIFANLTQSDAAVSAEDLYYDSDVVTEASKLAGKPINKPASAVNSLPTVTPFSRPMATPAQVLDWAYPRSA